MRAPAPWLETLRLELREFVAADFDDLVRLDSDPRVMRYIGNGKPSTRDAGRAACCARILALSALYPGSRHLARVAPRHRRVHRLVLAQVRRQDRRHRDRLPAAARRVGPGLRDRRRARRSRDYGFDDLGLHRIIGVTHPRQRGVAARADEGGPRRRRLGPLLRPAAAPVRRRTFPDDARPASRGASARFVTR